MKIKPLLTFLVATAFSVAANAASSSFSEGGITYTITSETTVTVTGYTDDLPTEVTIPAEIDGYTVTAIGESAFRDNNDIVSVSIPACVTSIGYVAFCDCASLKSVTFAEGNKIEFIDKYAFARCYELASITIPDGVTSIGDNAFIQCGKLTSTTIPANVTSIGEDAFYGCTTLSSVEFAEGSKLESIGEGAFCECKALTSFSFPDGVESIPANMFWGDEKLASVYISAGITSIGDNAFQDCNALSEITIAERNTAFATESGILYNKTQTEFVVIPNGISGALTFPNTLTSIPNNTFKGKNITSVVIPASVQAIGDKAFYQCKSLELVVFAEGSQLQSIGECAFSETAISSITLPANLTETGEWAFSGCSNLTTVEFEEGSKMQIISEGSFDNCKFTSITIPASVTEIKEYAFQYIPLESVVFEEGSQLQSLSDGAFYYTKLSFVILPQSITSVESEVFNTNTSTTIVLVPKAEAEVEWDEDAINSNATVYFSDSEGWGECGNCLYFITANGTVNIVAMPNSNGVMANYEAGSSPFYNNTNITKVNIIDATSIGENVFEGCSGITSVSIPQSVESVGANAFKGCTALDYVVVEKTADELSLADAAITADAKVYYKGDYYTVTLPEESIYSAESGNVLVAKDGVLLVRPGASITVKHEYHDKGYQYVQYVANPSNGCTVSNTLPTVFSNISSDITILPSFSFRFDYYYGEGLTIYPATEISGDFEIPAHITIDGEEREITGIGVFAKMQNLTSVVVPETVKRTETFAFMYCPSLTSIFVEGNEKFFVPGWGASSNYNSDVTTIYYKGEAFDYHVVLPEGVEATAAEGVIVGKSGNKVFVKTGAEITLSAPIGYACVVESGEATLTGNTLSAISSDVEISALKLITHPAISIASIEEQTYTGEELKPAVEVVDDLTALTEGTDFTVEYSNNKNAGTATVTINGIGKYTGETEVTFNIGKATPTFTEIDSEVIDNTQTLADVTLPAGYSFANAEQTLEVGENTVALNYNPDPDNYETVSGNMTVIVTSSIVTGVQDVQNTKSQNVKKYIENGTLIIEVDGVKYDVTGRVVK
ncbi:MAG: leucine-rich repeat domain-containing protein [Bacteroidales bacterium]|nr:leucine-rich repeat domain-containing protein [Bacteroidales bacterium]